MAEHSTSNYTDQNNIISGTAGTMEAVREPNSRFDFGIKWAGDDDEVSVPASPDQPSVGLVQGTFPMNPDFGAEAYKNGFGWDSGYAAISVDWVAGTLAGTIKENYYGCTFDAGGLVNVRDLLATRDNIDPGFGSIGSGRKGQQYSFIITGTEFRIYNSREAVPVVVLASPTQGPGYPLSLGGWVIGSATNGFNITDIRIARVRPNQFTTIYALRDQEADFGSAQTELHARIFQNATPPLTVNGAPVDVDL